MHSDFVSLCLPPCLFSDSATFPNLFLYLSFPALCLNPLQLLFLQLFCVLSSVSILVPLLLCLFFLNSHLFLLLHLSLSSCLSPLPTNPPSSLLQSPSPFLFFIPLFPHISPNVCLTPSIPSPTCPIYLCYCPSLPVTTAAVPTIRPLFLVAVLPPSPWRSLAPSLRRTAGRRCTAPLPPSQTGRGNESPRQLCTV